MAANYLHSPGTIGVENGTRPVRTVKPTVIGLIGAAPMRDVNTLVQCLSEKGTAAFDSQLTGFTIPQALDTTHDHNAGTVLVINVLDPVKHKTVIEDEVVTFDKSTGQTKLAYPVVVSMVVKNNEGSITHTTSTDYRVDAQTGVLMDLGKAIEAGSSVKVSYEHADPSKVTAADTISRANNIGNRTGMKLLNNSFNLYGYSAKILTMPVSCTQKSVAVEFIAMAEKLSTITYIDAPVGITFAQAPAGHDPEGTTNFNTNSDHIRLCCPRMKIYDPVTSMECLEPLSQHAVGLRARINLDRGYWWLSFNQKILGIAGVERRLSAMIDDPQSKVNLLNEQGATTVFSSHGSGLHLWGNRTTAWPTVTYIRSFGNIRRTGDMVNESIRCFGQQYTDMSITQALINALTELANAYGRKMADDGTVLGFRCQFDPARSPETELAAGHLLLSYKYTPPPPLE